MAIVDRLVNYLDKEKVEYRLVHHEPAGSADEYHSILGTRYEQQAKALLCRVKSNRQKSFAVIALQAHKQADLSLLARLLHAREVRLATAEQLLEVTGCRPGELPPFGRLFGTPLVFDSDLAREPEIYFNIGDLTLSVVTNPARIVEIESPTIF